MSDYPISPVTGEKPELTISSAFVNSQPVELDSTPTSPEKVRIARRGSKSALEDVTPEEREKRAKLISQRKHDPAVVVDIPQTPGAEELEKAGASAEASGLSDEKKVS